MQPCVCVLRICNCHRGAQAELERYLHYFKRFQGHNEGQKFAEKQIEGRTEQRMLQLLEVSATAHVLQLSPVGTGGRKRSSLALLPRCQQQASTVDRGVCAVRSISLQSRAPVLCCRRQPQSRPRAQT
jgi:hypothetical protein